MMTPRYIHVTNIKANYTNHLHYKGDFLGNVMHTSFINDNNFRYQKPARSFIF